MDREIFEPALDAEAMIRILRDVPIGITVQDGEGRLLFANHEARRILMAESEQLSPAQTHGFIARYELFDEHGRPLGLGELPGRRALAGEEVPDQIVHFRLKEDGDTHSVRLRAAPLRDVHGRVRFAVNVWTDVTDLVQMRDELGLRSRLLETETEESLQGILHASGAGEVLSVNQSLGKMLGKPRHELVGQAEADVLGLFCAGVPHGQPSRTFREGRLPHAETRWRVIRADRRSFEIRVVPLHTDGHEHLGRLWFFQELTGQRQAERSRRQVLREHQGRMLAEGGARRSGLLAEVGRVLGSNLDAPAALEAVARLSVPMVADLCVIDVVEGASTLRRLAVAAGNGSLQRVAQSLRRSLARTDGGTALQRALRQRVPVSGRISSPDEPFGRSPSTGPLAGEFVVAPLIGRDEVLGAATFLFVPPRLRDGERELIDALVGQMAAALDNASMYRRSLEAVHARDEFLAIAAHELRTPVTALQFALQLLQRSLPQGGVSDKTRASTEVAMRQSRRLTKLIENLLDISRIQAGKLSLNLEQVDLRALAQDVLERFQPECHASGCQVVLNAPAPVRGVWDRVRLEQILTNLVSNAIKYGSGRPIELSLHEEDGRAKVTVVDHGIGIKLSEQARLFGRFERLVSARHYGGLGLGLFITRQLVQALGGAIAVISDEGKGSTFTVELPVQVSHPVPVPDLPPPAAPA